MDRVQRITATPPSAPRWLAEAWQQRALFGSLARKDLATRYKRASFGVLWAVALPVLQGTVLALVFSKVARFGGTGVGYGAFVLSGIIPWSFFAASVTSATTSITEGATLADKVWFPRAALVTAPVGANSLGYLASLAVLVAAAPILHGHLGLATLLLVPGTILLIAFTLGASLCLAALNVYFRDTKFLVQAGLLVLIYLSPVIFDPRQVVPAFAGWFDLNPLTGILGLFRASLHADTGALARPLAVSVAGTIALLAAGVEVHRRHDRRFVDLL